MSLKKQQQIKCYIFVFCEVNYCYSIIKKKKSSVKHGFNIFTHTLSDINNKIKNCRSLHLTEKEVKIHT